MREPYVVHPADCNAVAKSRAFFDALAKFDHLPDGHALATAHADTFPDCDCYARPEPAPAEHVL